jgi:ATP-dependent exoDNAse (exonuclease V) beta subunit
VEQVMNLNKFTIQKSFAISAGAGSGKTYTLSRRYINALVGFDFFREDGFDELYYDSLKPATTKQIVTITYTEAAALEMKERIFFLIEKIINFENLENNDKDKESIKVALQPLDDTKKKYVITTLEDAIIQSSEAKISTIHSFCLDILKTNADVARFDATIDIAKDDEKENFIESAIFEVLNDKANLKNIESITKYLNLFFLKAIFKRYATSSQFRNNFNSFSDSSLDKKDLILLIQDLYKLPNIKDDYDYLCTRFDDIGLEPKYKDFLKQYIENYFNFEAVSWSELSKEFDVSIQFNRKPFNTMKDIKEYVENIKSYDSFFGAYTCIDEEKEKLFYTKISHLKSLMKQIKSTYDKKLQEIGKLDFDEIIFKTHQIISKVKTDIKYMMVDEFQDTNNIQYDIVKNALNSDTNLFVVGDSKQSIYSFQGAQIEVFNEAINDKNFISSIEPMDINYRSDGVVLKNVNNIFKNILKTDDSITQIKQNYEAQPQDLKVSKVSKDNIGSFSFLINSDDKSSEDESNEYKQIAQLIANIKAGNLPQYNNIKENIEQNNKSNRMV